MGFHGLSNYFVFISKKLSNNPLSRLFLLTLAISATSCPQYAIGLSTQLSSFSSKTQANSSASTIPFSTTEFSLAQATRSSQSTLIDDFESGKGGPNKLGGYWYTFSAGSSKVSPSPSSPLKPSA